VEGSETQTSKNEVNGSLLVGLSSISRDIIRLSDLSDLFPNLAMGFHTRDSVLNLYFTKQIGKKSGNYGDD
jgi:hypothetical protein